MHAFIYTIVAFFLFTGQVLAALPCLPMAESQFRREVLARANAVLIGEIVASSADASPDQQWTRVKPLEILRANGNISGIVTIEGWQALQEPLSHYRTGDKVLLLLTRSGKDWLLTDANWKACVPAVMEITPSGEIYPSFSLAKSSSHDQPLEIRTFSRYLLRETTSSR